MPSHNTHPEVIPVRDYKSSSEISDYIEFLNFVLFYCKNMRFIMHTKNIHHKKIHKTCEI